ncbi:MAG TPA: protein-L-isoaspartate(D-aspartate) O-methyltransferase [Thermoanaerobaculia bacterium]|nr:protein-L-isoaspartate(D-aspartate) O-methyltransferase [Thermoanaerobaculia bacterium]
MTDFTARRQRMIERQVRARGITDPPVLAALGRVPRESFVPDDLAEFAYDDNPLPIEGGQTISQPYVVAAMASALELSAADRVLEIGAGSGYAAAVLSHIAKEVYTIERLPVLAELARERCRDLGYDNVHVLLGDGTLGWPEQAPFDAIVAAAGGPRVPQALRDQLAVGGRLVMPVGDDPRDQELVRVRRLGEEEYSEETLGQVRFVPLIGEQGWPGPAIAPANPGPAPFLRPSPSVREHAAVTLIRECALPFSDLEARELDDLVHRASTSRVVLLGEASHGTSEFYQLRAVLTRRLIEHHGFNVVAVEADWPDSSRVDRHVRHRPPTSDPYRAFTRFPTWMWRNREFLAFVEWLREHNETLDEPGQQVSFHGLDLYSLYASVAAVLGYLDRVDPIAARVARERYGCLLPWSHDPTLYGRATLAGRYVSCEDGVVRMLRELLDRRLDYEQRDGELFLDAAQNASVVASAESYYRIMYYGSVESWNLRDRHMFDTLERLLAFRGPEAKAIVWAHNSHVGNAAATEMGARGEWNIGQLARQRWGTAAYLVGFGTDHGRVAAASRWDGPMEVKNVRPAHRSSYERLCHDTGVPAFWLPLRDAPRQELVEELASPRLERAIGVIYRPETELASHYFEAVLPEQFDGYLWLDETEAVAPLSAAEERGEVETYPFGL